MADHDASYMDLVGTLADGRYFFVDSQARNDISEFDYKITCVLFLRFYGTTTIDGIEYNVFYLDHPYALYLKGKFKATYDGSCIRGIFSNFPPSINLNRPIVFRADDPNDIPNKKDFMVFTDGNRNQKMQNLYQLGDVMDFVFDKTYQCFYLVGVGEKNVQSDWNEANNVSPAYIKNKPSLATVATSGEAEDVSYDNTTSELTATDVQAAIDEIDSSLDTVASGLSDKMDKSNPEGTGSFSMNRLSPSTVGPKSHAEGDMGTASGDDSHAEGFMTVASGDDSHSEGVMTTASGDAAHAEGSNAVAGGLVSHAEGYYTKASSDYQHVSGKFNVEDNADTYAEIIGNGTADNARSNARTLDWSGNETIAGDLYFNGGADPLSTQIAGCKASGYDESGDKTDTVATSATWSILSSIAITRGKWIINFGANFPSLGSGNTGHCGVGVSDSSTPSTRPPAESCLTAQRITNDNYTTLSGSFIYDCTSATKTLYLKVRQTSGQSLSVDGKLRVIKLPY